MKKITYLFSTVSIAVLLSACGDKSSNKNVTETTQTSETSQNTPSSDQNKNSEEDELGTKRQDQLDAVKKLIAAFKAKDVNAIAKLVSYPLRREAPIPTVKDEKEFVQRFDELFTAEFVKNIGESKPSEWDAVGSRGTMYSDVAGNTIWLSDDDSKIISVICETGKEKKILDSQKEETSKNIHESLSDFKKTIYILTTKKYKIRIDEMKNGKYRYAAWNNPNADMSTKPDIIVNNGELIIEGSLSIEHYEFKSGNIRYEIWPEDMSATNGDGRLMVYEGEKELLDHEAKTIFPK